MKRLTRMLLAIVMCIVAAFGLFGCTTVEDNAEKLYVRIQNLGYGAKWLQDAAALYTQKTGTEVEVTPSNVLGQISTHMMSDKNNNTDLYFNATDAAGYYLNLSKGSSVIPGYDTLWVDISDVYQEIPEGYGNDKTIAELVDGYALKTMTYEGKQYAFSWASGTQGIIYHKDLFEENNIPIPRTTDELLEVCQLIQGKNLKTANGRTVYPFTWTMGYLRPMTLNWWFQYEGKEAFENYCEGKGIDGQYSAEGYMMQAGKLYSYQVFQELLDFDNKYVVPSAIGQSFTQNQIQFLEGEAMMMMNGDWLQREAESNFSVDEVSIEFMPTPVISNIVEVIKNDLHGTIDTEEKLREAITYIDKGEIGVNPYGFHEEDLAYVRQARNSYNVAYDYHIAYIPSYSNNIDGAKDFIKFLYSKEAQELIMKSSYGNTFVKADLETFDTYDEMTPLLQSKNRWLKNPDAMEIGPTFYSKIYYVGGLNHYNERHENMAVSKDSATYQTAAEILQSYYNEFSPFYEGYMRAAGVSN